LSAKIKIKEKDELAYLFVFIFYSPRAIFDGVPMGVYSNCALLNGSPSDGRLNKSRLDNRGV
jgi:hypothetical protein